MQVSAPHIANEALYTGKLQRISKSVVLKSFITRRKVLVFKINYQPCNNDLTFTKYLLITMYFVFISIAIRCPLTVMAAFKWSTENSVGPILIASRINQHNLTREERQEIVRKHAWKTKNNRVENSYTHTTCF